MKDSRQHTELTRDGDTYLVPLSALERYAFCPRQCALFHTECMREENWHTAQGNLLHERVHGGEPEMRRGMRQERGVAVSSLALGVVGKLDLLEIRLSDGALFPVEYKKGRPSREGEDWERIQLCAQAMCLEEMLNVVIPEAFIWYWRTRRRESVLLDEALRERTVAIAAKLRALLQSGRIPEPRKSAGCRSCSLQDLCMPDAPGEKAVMSYVRDLFRADRDDEALLTGDER